jgi:endonuclease/exonuclease/phosphatase family metal-dependent hydrolase
LRKLALHRENRQLSGLNKLVLWIHYFIIVGLLVAICAKYISPYLFWIPAFFGLAFPYLFCSNILLIIYWLAQFKPAITFGIVAFCLSVPTAYRYVQISIPGDKSETRELKVTSYNCMLFDLYNWYHNNETRPGIFANLMEIKPDILCLQEFYTSEQIGDFNNIDSVRQFLKLPYYHTEFTTTLRTFDHWGIATFSKYPIINQGKIIFNTRSNNICIFSDIVVNSDTIRVYNIHLQSISFSQKDNKFLEELTSEKNVENELTSSKSILRRLKRAFLKRTKQADMIAAHMKTCRYKLIVCGDFNDTAASYAYEKLSQQLKDTFIERGFGFGRTYAGKWPQFRIDYILHDEALHCSRYKRSTETFTDHFPITAYFDTY